MWREREERVPRKRGQKGAESIWPKSQGYIGMRSFGEDVVSSGLLRDSP